MFLGVALPLLFALAHGLAPRSSSPWLLLLYLGLAVIQLTWLAVWRGVIADMPALLFLCMPVLFLVGPLGWLHARWLRGLPSTPRTMLHFLPAVVALGYALFAFGAWQPGQPLRQPGWLVALSGSGAVYMLRIFRPIARIRRPGRLRLERWLVLAFALIGLAVGGAALLGAVFNTAFDAAYLALIPLLLIALYLLEARYPALMAVVSEAADAEAQGYRRSTLASVDVEAVVTALARLMDEEHLYQQEGLSLPSLADALGLSAHQLSELLNEKLGRSFSLFLKEKRVAAACARLRAEPDEAILGVGLAVGFSSSSAFYAAFREITGKAPGQFRRDPPAPEAAPAPQR
jgi:AraC-like DNA-binding protein